MKSTIYDVAKLSGVSKSTVSRYLNHGSISENKKDAIKKAIDQLGFQQNLTATRLKAKKTGLIGVIMKGIQSTSVSKMLSTMNDELIRNNYQPLIMIIPSHEKSEESLIRKITQQNIEGLIFGSDKISVQVENELLGLKIPVVIVGQKNDSFPYVKVDDYTAGKLVAGLALKSHNRSLVFIGPDKDPAIGIERRKGVLETFAEHSSVKLHFINSDHEFRDGYISVERALEYDPDMIIAATDRIAYGVLAALRDLGKKVPEDVSVVGFGNYEFSEITDPPLTSVKFCQEQVAIQSINLILSFIESKEISGRHIIIPPALMIRKSVKEIC